MRFDEAYVQRLERALATPAREENNRLAAALTAVHAEAAALKADRDEWMASSAGYGSDMVEWKIRAQQAEATAARLREALEWLRPRVDGDELDHIDAALAAKEADRG
jgi:hypothetical protein